MVRTIKLLLLLLLSASQLFAQAPERYTSGEIHEKIQKLNFLGSALYVAAHPDDENTRLIAYLSNELKAHTAYLSLTRGDGGQNLIGPEIRELLGVMRTQELLAARSVDGGNQMFTRANDFGYSKHPDETFRIWNKKEVTADVVWAIRKWQPDVIINRFDHRSPGTTHGHHTGSAMLSVEAFDLVGDKSVYPEQLEYVDTWQPRRLFFNTSWWFYGSQDAFKKADKSTMLSVDAGVYYPVKGKSNTEIAAESRSMHKCQGFGSAGTRGEQSEYLELIKGDMPENGEIFEGINTSWTRVKGGKPIGVLMAGIEADFDYQAPYKSVPALLKARKMIKALPDGYWKRVKLTEIEEVIEACLGLFLEAVADNPSATPGQDIELTLEMINRSPLNVSIESVSYQPMQLDTSLQMTLEPNVDNKLFKTISLPDDMAYTNPYWLNKKANLGMYTVEEQLLRGLPETPRAFKVQFTLQVEGEPMFFEKEVAYKYTDPVKGEVYQPFELIPTATARLGGTVYVFPDQKSQEIEVVVKAGKENLSGTVELCHPDGWSVSPKEATFELKLKGEEASFRFQLTPPAGQSEGLIGPIVHVDGQDYQKEMVIIDYDHIPRQTVLRNAEAKVVRIELEKRGERIGYIMGAGDDIPASLEQIGYQVDLLDDKDMNPENLKQYDAIIAGIRAYNTVDRMKFWHSRLLEYVEQGGTYMIQYNTTRSLKMPSDQIGPYPFKLSRDRVADEEAEVRFLAPDHPVLNSPNKITAKDFEGWVQERGLYFPNEWDERYTAVLSANDVNEPARDGGLLVTEYGKGHFIYSGYSWFRELPAGVPGAFRLFANLVSIGKE